MKISHKYLLDDEAGSLNWLNLGSISSGDEQIGDCIIFIIFNNFHFLFIYLNFSMYFFLKALFKHIFFKRILIFALIFSLLMFTLWNWKLIWSNYEKTYNLKYMIPFNISTYSIYKNVDLPYITQPLVILHKIYNDPRSRLVNLKCRQN